MSDSHISLRENDWKKWQPTGPQRFPASSGEAGESIPEAWLSNRERKMSIAIEDKEGKQGADREVQCPATAAADTRLVSVTLHSASAS